jgi:hypothetical protein
MKAVKTLMIFSVFLFLGSVASATALQTSVPCNKASVAGLLDFTKTTSTYAQAPKLPTPAPGSKEQVGR